MPSGALIRFLGGALPVRPKQHEERQRRGRHQAAAPPGHGGGAPAKEPAGAENAGGEAAPGEQPEAARLPRAMGVAALLSGARQWGFLWKALTVHSANLAAQLAARPLQPLQDRLQRELANTAAVREACRQLQVEGLQELQDLMNCIILSEHVYKIVDHSTETSVSLINDVKAEFPPHLVTLKSVQWAQPHVKHRFLLGEGPDALYVAFMGTKLPRDMATNVNAFQEEVVLESGMLSNSSGAEISSTPPGGRPPLLAHRGFLARARSIPIQQLYAEARARGKRLVLTGHSLGGAVASLCAIRLLQHLPPSQHGTVSVYGFATPALGNTALAATVAECGWDQRIRNYINPDDPIPRLLNRRQLAGSEAAAAAAAATAVPAPAPAAAAAAKETASGDSEAPRPAAVAQAAVLATAAAAAAVTGAAPADAGSVNSIQAASRLMGAQQRLHRVAGHVAADGSSSGGALVAEAGLLSGVRSLARSASAPALLGAPEAAAAEASAAAATSAAVTAAVLGQQGQAAVDAAAAAAAAAAEASTAAAMSGKPPGSGLRWRWGPPLRRVGSAALAAAAPPVRAAVERAGSAARMVAMPLSAAASVPMRAAPQYLPLGRQLYILAGQHVTDTKPSGSGSSSGSNPANALAAAAAVVAPGGGAAAPRRLPWSPFWRRDPSSSEPVGGSEDEEDNVDVAAAQRLAAAGTAGASLASASLDDGPIPGTAQQPRGVFAAHRMATYRHRLLGICQAALEGRLMVRSLPMLPSLPRPGDVAATELVAPPMFPLRAVATLEPCPAAVAAGAPVPTSPPKLPTAAAAAHGHAAEAHARHAPTGSADGATGSPAPAQQPQRQPGFWQRLLGRGGQQQQDPPIDLFIRVDGRGLENVTRAWVDGMGPALADAGKAGSGGTGTGSSSVDAREAVAEVSIMQQPRPRLPLHSAEQRPPLPVVGHVSAFFSWLAVTLGMLGVLRQLQPAGRNDYLIARVQLPASMVHRAWQAAENKLLTDVTDGPLLRGLHLGPRPALHLQSDFAVHSVPLDIRIATPIPHPGWEWPWRRRRPSAAHTPRPAGHATAAAAAHAPQPAGKELRARPRARWWDWPAPAGPAAAAPVAGSVEGSTSS